MSGFQIFTYRVSIGKIVHSQDRELGNSTNSDADALFLRDQIMPNRCEPELPERAAQHLHRLLFHSIARDTPALVISTTRLTY
jgi:hypothetical protein